ncbi:MAG: Si-specific NAD(P)(+) transhydrogenase [Burkholderiales bacterium]|nr:Si-specific NAD(P)(+) transhydrogenase [Phycisphaerae bacterium]
MRHFDCVVIGSGPAGQKAAIQAAKLGRRVCVIEKGAAVGGAAINTGTIPSKALREAVLHLTGTSKRLLFGENSRMKKQITIDDLIYVSQKVIHHELALVREYFERNDVELINGAAHFESPNMIQVVRGNESEHITADKYFIAIGTRPAKPASVPFDNKAVFCSDGLLKIGILPRSMIVVGGGVIGTEYACMMAALGVKVTLVEGRQEVLGFLDREIVEALMYQMRRTGITLRMGEKVAKIEKIAANGNGHNEPLVSAVLESGKTLRAQTLLYAIGRQGMTGLLQVEKAGITADDRERLKVNASYQTNVEHIYAVGDVIGFPALASTAMEQGRLAACHAYGQPVNSVPELFPLGVYAIPEVSQVGKTEQQLTDAGIPYEAGIAEYRELARGQLLGDEDGLLKLLIHQDTHEILGVHAIGTGATELIHIGQAVMAFKGTVEFFINNVFNYPTLAEAYKVAALNGLNKIRHV